MSPFLVEYETTLEHTISRLSHVKPKGLLHVIEDEEGPVSTKYISILVQALDRSSVGGESTSP